jgi:hypothetical protein
VFERLVGTMFSKAEMRHARAFQADGRAINEKFRLYARVGAALIGRARPGRTRSRHHHSHSVGALSRQRRRSGSVARPEDFDIPTRGWASTMP